MMEDFVSADTPNQDTSNLWGDFTDNLGGFSSPNFDFSAPNNYNFDFTPPSTDYNNFNWAGSPSYNGGTPGLQDLYNNNNWAGSMQFDTPNYNPLSQEQFQQQYFPYKPPSNADFASSFANQYINSNIPTRNFPGYSQYGGGYQGLYQSALNYPDYYGFSTTPYDTQYNNALGNAYGNYTNAYNTAYNNYANSLNNNTPKLSLGPTQEQSLENRSLTSGPLQQTADISTINQENPEENKVTNYLKGLGINLAQGTGVSKLSEATGAPGYMVSTAMNIPGQGVEGALSGLTQKVPGMLAGSALSLIPGVGPFIGAANTLSGLFGGPTIGGTVNDFLRQQQTNRARDSMFDFEDYPQQNYPSWDLGETPQQSYPEGISPQNNLYNQLVEPQQSWESGYSPGNNMQDLAPGGVSPSNDLRNMFNPPQSQPNGGNFINNLNTPTNQSTNWLGELAQPKNITTLLGTLGQLFTSNKNMNAARGLGSGTNVIDPFGAQRPFYQQQLQQTYTNPMQYYNSPGYQALQNIYKDQLERQDAARGRRSQYGSRDLNLMNYFLANLDKERGQLGGFAGANIPPNAQAAVNALNTQIQQRNQLYGAIPGALAYMFKSNQPLPQANSNSPLLQL